MGILWINNGLYYGLKHKMGILWINKGNIMGLIMENYSRNGSLYCI